jgi:hypothetical protein
VAFLTMSLFEYPTVCGYPVNPESDRPRGKVSKGDFVMKNGKGVILDLKAVVHDLALDPGAEGLKITME